MERDEGTKCKLTEVSRSLRAARKWFAWRAWCAGASLAGATHSDPSCLRYPHLVATSSVSTPPLLEQKQRRGRYSCQRGSYPSEVPAGPIHSAHSLYPTRQRARLNQVTSLDPLYPHQWRGQQPNKFMDPVHGPARKTLLEITSQLAAPPLWARELLRLLPQGLPARPSMPCSLRGC